MATLNRTLGFFALLALLGSAAADDIITVPAPPNSGNTGLNGEFTLPPRVNPTGPGPVITTIGLTRPGIAGVNPQGRQNGNNGGFVPPDLLATPPGTNTATPPAPQVDPFDIDTGNLPIAIPATDDTPATPPPAAPPPATGTQPGTPADTGGQPQWPAAPAGTHVPSGQHPGLPTPGSVRNNAENTTNNMLNSQPGNPNAQVFSTTRGIDQEHYAVTNSINNIRNDNAGALTIEKKFDPLLHWKHPTRRPCEMWSTVETGAMLRTWLDRFGGAGYEGREPSWTYDNNSNIKDGIRMNLNRMILRFECIGSTLQLVKVEGKTTTVVFADLREPGQKVEVEIGDIPEGVNLGPAITNELRTRDELDTEREERRDKAAELSKEEAGKAADPGTDDVARETGVDANDADGNREPPSPADPSDEADVTDQLLQVGGQIVELEKTREDLEDKLKDAINSSDGSYQEAQDEIRDVNAQLDALYKELDKLEGAADEPAFSYEPEYSYDRRPIDMTPVASTPPAKEPPSKEHQVAMDARDRDADVPAGKIYYDAYQANKSPKEFEELSDDMKWFYAAEEGIAIRNLARDEKLEQDLAAIQAEQDAADARIAARQRWEALQADREAELEALDEQLQALQLQLSQAINDGDKDKQRAIEKEFDELHDRSLEIYTPLTWEQAQMDAGEDERIQARNQQFAQARSREVLDMIHEAEQAARDLAKQTENPLAIPVYFMAGVGKACWAGVAEPFLITGDYVNWLRDVDYDYPNSGLFKMAAEHDGAIDISQALVWSIINLVPEGLEALRTGDCVKFGEVVTNTAMIIAGGYGLYKSAPRIRAAAHSAGITISNRVAQFIETIGRWREARANGTMTRALDAAYQAEVRWVVREGVENFRTWHKPDKPWTEADYVAFEEAMYKAYLEAEMLEDHTVWGKVYREFKPYEPKFPRDADTATDLRAANDVNAMDDLGGLDSIEKTDVMRPGGVNPKRLGDDPNTTPSPLEQLGDFSIDLTTEAGKQQLHDLSKQHTDWILEQRRKAQNLDDTKANMQPINFDDARIDELPDRAPVDVKPPAATDLRKDMWDAMNQGSGETTITRH